MMSRQPNAQAQAYLTPTAQHAGQLGRSQAGTLRKYRLVMPSTLGRALELSGMAPAASSA